MKDCLSYFALLIIKNALVLEIFPGCWGAPCTLHSMCPIQYWYLLVFAGRLQLIMWSFSSPYGPGDKGRKKNEEKQKSTLLGNCKFLQSPSLHPWSIMPNNNCLQLYNVKWLGKLDSVKGLHWVTLPWSSTSESRFVRIWHFSPKVPFVFRKLFV